MKRLIIIFTIIILSSISLKSQHTLTIVINDLENNKGIILLDFTDDQENTLKGIFKEIKNNKCIIRIPNIKPGKYAFKYFHDENKNKELDTNWLGIPTEGFGFSNNAKGTFGPPAFEKTIFEIKGNLTIKCIPKYY